MRKVSEGQDRVVMVEYLCVGFTEDEVEDEDDRRRKR